MSEAKRWGEKLRRERADKTRLLEEVESLRRQIERLRRDKEDLLEEVEHWKRQAHRQAAPFRRPARRKIAPEQRKKPGRRPRHPGRRRPLPQHVDRELEACLQQCPRCGGEVAEVRALEQFVEEIPASRPQVSRIVTYQGRCRRCGVVRSRHPEQVSNAQGAARVHLGPRALARAAQLNKEHGLSMRKTCQVLHDLHGLKLSPGGLSQALDRTAERLRPAYRDLRDQLRAAPAVHADETSWWVGEPGWWLWVMADVRTTLYRVENHRSSRVVREVLGEDFQGCLISDCLATYNTLPYRQHKCVAHHLKAISEAARKASGGELDYLRQWKLFFRTVLAVHRQAGLPGAPLLESFRPRFRAWCRRLLESPPPQPAALSVHKRLNKQLPHLLTCLQDLAVEPTNNRAERALRPAVIARKISCGNKTLRGRRTWETLASLAATYRQRGLDFVDSATPYLILHPPHPPPG